jgi:hypothetical protein
MGNEFLGMDGNRVCQAAQLLEASIEANSNTTGDSTHYPTRKFLNLEILARSLVIWLAAPVLSRTRQADRVHFLRVQNRENIQLNYFLLRVFSVIGATGGGGGESGTDA